MTLSATGFKRALALFGLLVLLPGPVAAELPGVTGVRAGKNTAATRFVLDLTQAVDFTVFTLPDPYRVVIDLPEVTWRLSPNVLVAGRGVIQGFRYGLFRPGRSRVVLDVRGPVVVKNAFLLKPIADFAYRFVLDLEEVSTSAFQQQARLTPPPKVAPPPPPPKALPPPVGKHVVVIDPGHGGVDPGTIGLSGVYEKHITLAATLELKRALEATGRYVVVTTRSRDVFVSLHDRVAKARAAGAELFVSLHCDAVDNARVRGATVYTLSERASDADAAALAAKENRADIIAGLDIAAEAYDEEVANILIDLAQRATTNAASSFAERLVKEIGAATKLRRNTHRFAGFRVLRAPDVPSVLVELGYLSNRQDAKQLESAAFRGKLIRAIVRAIEGFFAAKSRVPT